MRRKVLVTGATGFVGRQIVRALGEADVSVVPVVRAGKEELVAGLPNVKRVVSTNDLFKEDEIWWAKQNEDIDMVIHAAWYAEPGKYIKSALNFDCLIGSLQCARGATRAGVRRFVGIGSCFEYDLSAGVLSIDTPLKPSTPYATAKAALYMSLLSWFSIYSIEFAWCRLFYLYGEGEVGQRLVPYLRNQLAIGKPAELTSGKQVRDFLDVTEAAKKIVHVALNDYKGAINVCSGTPVTVRQLAEQIADEYGRRDLLHFGKRADNLVDPSYVLGMPNV